MPIYEYQCEECGLRFQKLWKRISTAETVVPCEECENPEVRKLVSAANHKFKHSASQTRGTLPPNTGTSDDWNFDKTIGRDAEQKWKTVEKRDTEKNRVVRQEREAGRGVTRDHLVPKPEGSYRVITEKERVKANANRTTAFEIAQAAKKQKKETPSKKE